MNMELKIAEVQRYLGELWAGLLEPGGNRNKTFAGVACLGLHQLKEGCFFQRLAAEAPNGFGRIGKNTPRLQNAGGHA